MNIENCVYLSHPLGKVTEFEWESFGPSLILFWNLLRSFTLATTAMEELVITTSKKYAWFSVFSFMLHMRLIKPCLQFMYNDIRGVHIAAKPIFSINFQYIQ
jgi:hypothetical protein